MRRQAKLSLEARLESVIEVKMGRRWGEERWDALYEDHVVCETLVDNEEEHYIFSILLPMKHISNIHLALDLSVFDKFPQPKRSPNTLNKDSSWLWEVKYLTIVSCHNDS